ncbi:MAG: restriction endonuclease subunit S [Burkholderiales bacterium]
MSRYESYSAHKDSGVEWIGQIPEHWMVPAVGHRYEVALGKMLDEKRISGEHLAPYLRNVDVQWDHVNVQDLPEMDFRPSERERYRLKAGDLLVCEGGEVGRAAIWNDQLPECYYQKALHRLRPTRPDRDCPRFMYYLLHSAVASGIFTDGGGKSTIAHLPAETLRAYRLPFPDVAEQRDIVRTLDRETIRIDALIAKKTKFIDLLDKKRQVLITQSVTKGLNPKAKARSSSYQWMGEIPVHWQIAPLKYVARLESGHTPSRQHPEYWENCTVPWFTLADIWRVRKAGQVVVSETAEKVSELGLANSSARKLPAGTVILSRTASVGFPAIMGTEMATSQDFGAWICGPRLHNVYLYYVLLAMRPELDRLMIGSTHKTIYMPDIEAFRCPLPPVEEQRSIAEYLTRGTQRIDTIIAKTRESIELITRRRSALITAAVTGQIDLRESA